MRCLTAVLAFLFATLVAGTGFAQGDTPKGLFLPTDYPSQTVRAGEVTTIRLKLTNAGLPPEPVALSLQDVPAGWKIDILGGGQPVAAAMPGVNQSVSLQLRVDVPKDAKPGSQQDRDQRQGRRSRRRSSCRSRSPSAPRRRPSSASSRACRRCAARRARPSSTR